MAKAHPTLGRYNNSRGMIASTPGQSGGVSADAMSVQILVELWILSCLSRADEPLWGQAILAHVRESTRIISKDTVLYPGYTLSNGHLYNVLKEYAEHGYIDRVEASSMRLQDENLTGRKQAWRITDSGRAYFRDLREKYKAAMAGALRSLEVLVSRVYDVDVISTPVVFRDGYTTREGDPDKII